MNIRKNMTISLALAALALGLTTTVAGAQPVLNGSFELPAAVYFGDTLLQPGQYSISISTEVRDLAYVQKISVSGEGVSKTFLAISKPTPESGRNCLKITRIADDTYVVDTFDTGVLGRSFSFGMTKNVRNKMLRASAGPSIALPVSTAAGL
jgi:hypothetical protein